MRRLEAIGIIVKLELMRNRELLDKIDHFQRTGTKRAIGVPL
jgi:hypothetical protein